MIAAPQDGGDVHLEILSRLIVMLMDPDFCSKLRSASDPEEFLQITDRQEAEMGYTIKVETDGAGGAKNLPMYMAV